MNGTVNESQIAVLFQESLDGLGTSMRRAVVDDPEDPSGLAVGTTPHDLIHEAIEGGNATLGFAMTEDLGAGGRRTHRHALQRDSGASAIVGNSQAMALTRTTSSEGKNRGTPRALAVF